MEGAMPRISKHIPSPTSTAFRVQKVQEFEDLEILCDAALNLDDLDKAHFFKGRPKRSAQILKERDVAQALRDARVLGPNDRTIKKYHLHSFLAQIKQSCGAPDMRISGTRDQLLQRVRETMRSNRSARFVPILPKRTSLPFYSNPRLGTQPQNF